MDFNLTSCRQSKYESASQMAIAPTLLHCFDYSLADVQGLAFCGSTIFMISVSFTGTVFVFELDIVHIPASFTFYLFDGVVTSSSFGDSVTVINGLIWSLHGSGFGSRLHGSRIWSRSFEHSACCFHKRCSSCVVFMPAGVVIHFSNAHADVPRAFWESFAQPSQRLQLGCVWY